MGQGRRKTWREIDPPPKGENKRIGGGGGKGREGRKGGAPQQWSCTLCAWGTPNAEAVTAAGREGAEPVPN